jgi:7-cyano-7-deazaguanine synthase
MISHRDIRNNKSNVCVLLSGGIDSTACVHFYSERKNKISTLYIDYGQLSAYQELKSAKQISKYYDVELKVLKLKGPLVTKKDYICGRNSFLLMASLMEMPNNDTMALGIHAGTNYSDCSPAFIENIQSIFDLYTKGLIQVCAPFLNWTKSDIWQYCIQKKIPVRLTYSCEYGKKQPCGKCLSCKDMEALNAGKM